MAGKRVKIECANIQLGMYVAQLDRSWLETPFLFQGFEIKLESDIEQIRQYCQYIYVDVTRGSLSAEELDKIIRPVAQPASLVADRAKRESSTKSKKGFFKRVVAIILNSKKASDFAGTQMYKNTATTKDEAPRAAKTYQNAVIIMNGILDNVRDGRSVDVENVRSAVSPMIDSVLRNPDAMSWFVTLQKQDEYTYHHSIASSVWAVVFGRHLGFDRASLEKLAIGGMLLDVGKSRISKDLLQKPTQISAQESDLLRQHVDFSVDMVKNANGIGKDILEMIQSHHERQDGSGYPQGLKDTDIPVYAKIAGLVDCYDAMVTNRPYAAAKSSYDAIRELNSLAGTLFQKELVEQFVQALGMFPTGTLVELNTGEIGIVIEQNRVRRLRPKVMLLLDSKKQPMATPDTIDLRKQSSNERDSDALFIDRGHEPGAFGIDPKDYFM